MVLKNDKERIAFLEDYTNEEHGWYVWKYDEDLGRRMWRLDIEDNQRALIVEEHLMTHTYPKKEVRWTLRKWYMVTDWKLPFEDHTASKTIILNYIKHLKEFAS